MLQTEEQRRWWFATHPEFSSSHKKGRARGDKREEENGSEKYSREDVDEYVDEQLKYATGREAEFLRIVKSVAGTEGASQATGQESGASGWDTEAREGDARPSRRVPGLGADAETRFIFSRDYPLGMISDARLRELSRLPQDTIIRFIRWLDALWRNNQLIVDPNSPEHHHGYPLQYVEYFLKCGLTLKEAVMILRAGDHRLKEDGGVHTGEGPGGDWNRDWEKFIDKHPPRNTPEHQDKIRDQLWKMIKKYKLDEKAIQLPPRFQRK